MPRFEPLSDARDERLADYAGVREAVLLRHRGVFIAESREVVRTLITATGYAVRSVLVTETARQALADALERLPPVVPVWVAPQCVIEGVVGYNVHRGCMAAAERGPPRSLDELIAGLGAAAMVLVLEGVSNPDNVGSLFRSALALGAAGVVLAPGCADPLYRKAIRTSMAAVLRLPFVQAASLDQALAALRRAGCAVVALSPSAHLPTIDRLPAAALKRTALLLGAEGEGLSGAALGGAQFVARIRMTAGVDSLNVATAGAIALYELGRQRQG